MDWFGRFFGTIWPRSVVGEEDRLADTKRAAAWVDGQLKPSCAASYMNDVAKEMVLRMAHGVATQRNVNRDGTISDHPVTIEGAADFVWRELIYAVHDATGVAELLFAIQRCDLPWQQHPIGFLRWITVEAGNVRAELARESDVVDLRDPEVPRIFIQRIECGHVLALFLSDLA